MRQDSNVPIILISALRGEVEMILGLDCSADDYVTKPFSQNHVIMRPYHVGPIPPDAPAQ